jgi:hypothetical protein
MRRAGGALCVGAATRRKATGRCAWERRRAGRTGRSRALRVGRSQVRRRHASSGTWRAGENRTRPEACARDLAEQREPDEQELEWRSSGAERGRVGEGA